MEKVLMVMLTAAFDVSQDQPHRRYLVVGGFVSEASCWTDFDREWRERLRGDGLSYFHMHSFAQCANEFKTWRGQERKRRQLLSDLLDIICAHVYHKFAVVVKPEVISSLSEDARERLGGTPISAAGWFVTSLVYQWRDRERYRNKPEIVFEEGDEGKGSLMKVINELTGEDPLFRHKKDNPGKGIVAFTPLQAADILAYEVKKITDDIGHELSEEFRFRFPYLQLDKIPGEPRIFPLQAVGIAEMLLGLDKYFAANPLGETMQYLVR